MSMLLHEIKLKGENVQYFPPPTTIPQVTNSYNEKIEREDVVAILDAIERTLAITGNLSFKVLIAKKGVNGHNRLVNAVKNMVIRAIHTQRQQLQQQLYQFQQQQFQQPQFQQPQFQQPQFQQPQFQQQQPQFQHPQFQQPQPQFQFQQEQQQFQQELQQIQRLQQLQHSQQLHQLKCMEDSSLLLAFASYHKSGSCLHMDFGEGKCSWGMDTPFISSEEMVDSQYGRDYSIEPLFNKENSLATGMAAESAILEAQSRGWTASPFFFFPNYSDNDGNTILRQIIPEAIIDDFKLECIISIGKEQL